MERETGKQLSEQRERWNARAGGWDIDLKDPKHYANFENGYQRFLDFERVGLEGVHAGVGVDLGSGTGIAASVLAEKVDKLFLLDLAENMLKEAGKKFPKATLVQAQATETPFPDQSMDVIISRGILISHLPAELVSPFFNEMKRIIKPGGKILFDFVCYPESANFKLSSPKNVFSLEQMATELQSFGFTDIRFEGDNKTRVVRVSAISS